MCRVRDVVNFCAILGGMATILVVDDDAFLRQIYSKELKGEGFAVIAAASGEQAIKLLKTEKPALILLDIIMPGQDGFDVLETVKADSALKAVPVVVLTNITQRVDMERAKSLGAADYINKADIEVGDLTKVVKKFLG